MNVVEFRPLPQGTIFPPDDRIDLVRFGPLSRFNRYGKGILDGRMQRAPLGPVETAKGEGP